VQATLVRTVVPEIVEVAEEHRVVAPVTARVSPAADIVEEWGIASFPASDPPSNW
jgi:hypothetical protein